VVVTVNDSLDDENAVIPSSPELFQANSFSSTAPHSSVPLIPPPQQNTQEPPETIVIEDIGKEVFHSQSYLT
jgi:hypothetical protein